MPEDAGIVPRTVLTLALAVRLSNNSTRSHSVSSCDGEPKCENNELNTHTQPSLIESQIFYHGSRQIKLGKFKELV